MKQAAGAILCIVFMSLCMAQSTEPAQKDTTPEPLVSSRTPFGICTNPQLYPYLPRLGAFWTFTGILWEDVEPEQDVWTF